MAEFNRYMPFLDPNNKYTQIILSTSFYIIVDEIDNFSKTKVKFTIKKELNYANPMEKYRFLFHELLRFWVLAMNLIF